MLGDHVEVSHFFFFFFFFQKEKTVMIADSFVDLGSDSAVIVGGGLVGCLLGVYLRKRGFPVTIFESRADPRLHAESGRSINLILTSRGIAALMGASEEVASRIMAITVPVFGRSLHSQQSQRTYQPYGPDHSYCNFSVSRWELNTLLMTEAEKAGCKIVFNHPLMHIDIPNGILFFYLQVRKKREKKKKEKLGKKEKKKKKERKSS